MKQLRIVEVQLKLQPMLDATDRELPRTWPFIIF